ncbi:hypothetical protein [Actinoplanes sp. NPDC049802]|uniref:hypothetical protein n=1 Tax=Actinoplanes sp. NPDC049802 TaxID=3154742 RepID=UPI0034032312
MNVLLGGLITLAVTALVQILIIPWVQRRTRRLERWEKDMVELATLLHEELPQAVSDAYQTAVLHFSVKDSELHEEEFRKEMSDQHNAAIIELHKLTTRMHLLNRRVRLMKPNAPVWSAVTARIQHLDKTIRPVYALHIPKSENRIADINSQWEEIRKDLVTAQERLDSIAIPMKPPPTTRLGTRAYRRRRRRLMRQLSQGEDR